MRTFRKIIKYSTITIGGLLGVMLCLYLVVVIVNWKDQPRSALAVTTLEKIQYRPVIADKENAYIFIGADPDN